MKFNLLIIALTGLSNFVMAKSNVVLDIAYADMHVSKAQHINMVDLIGNDYTTSQSRQSNVMLGLSYYRPLEMKFENIDFLYGLNLTFFNTNNFSGDIIQESLFSNLSYTYSVINLPIYASLKAQINPWVLELGIGPNIMFLYDYKENVINPNTLAKQTFLSNTSAQFSANAGIAYQFQTPLFKNPLEIGYRFFYLGKGHFKPASDQILSSLETANIYANTLMLSITF